MFHQSKYTCNALYVCNYCNNYISLRSVQIEWMQKACAPNDLKFALRNLVKLKYQKMEQVG